jgi:hypothetical protein
MKLRKIISGGQTGADRTGLEEAKKLGLETGGTAPKGWKIDGGTDPSLKDFGLVESRSTDYAVRTRENVRDSDATIWFGKVGSPGYWCTRNACKTQDKFMFENPAEGKLHYICESFEVINIAGNRERIYPPVVAMTREWFSNLAKLLGKSAPN